MSHSIPEAYRDLLERPVVVALATINPDGQPQVTPVWCDYDGEFIRVNSADGRQKVRNMQQRPQVTLLFIDPDNPYRWMEVRGEVAAITAEGAVDHINALSKKYRGVEDYYSRNEAQRGKETRLIFAIRPKKVIAAGA
ncbi:MAG: PPOX class F420-dependent oxidoreductase [Anaerolinea sp.]|nr:PPOX class F420-dependent oxidoreductase [Anaerolinea sp.]